MSHASVTTALENLRGGASLSETEEEDILVGTRPLQSLLSSILDSLGRISPGIADALRFLIETLEKAIGLELLPKKTKKKTRKSAKVKGSKKASRPEPSETNDTPRRKKGEDTTETTKRTKKANAIVPKPEKKAPQKSKTVVSAAQKHLLTDLKASSPNYRIQRELKQFIQDPPPNLSVKVGKNMRIWIVTMKAVEGSVYEGETFQLRIQFPPQYPIVPPSVYFLPPHIPLHEHVYTNGDICLSLLGKHWAPTMTAQSIAVSIQSILNSANRKELPMDNAQHAQNKPGQYQKDWIYHDVSVASSLRGRNIFVRDGASLSESALLPASSYLPPLQDNC
jgi:ubiquitin-conjugating enzyme E2 W